MSPVLAHRAVRCGAQIRIAIEGIADMRRSLAARRSDANDPIRKSHAGFCCDAQSSHSKDVVGYKPQFEGTMRRREFIVTVGGAAAAWPLVARAQQPERMRRIGMLMTLAADDPFGQAQVAAFQQALQQLGWNDGRNVRIDIRWDESDPDRARRYAQELVALAPDIFLAGGTISLGALQHVTRALPIVFANVADPVGAGFVDSLSRPGGNITGFTTYEYGFSGKWLELLKQIAPQVTRADVIRNPDTSFGIGQFSAIQAVAPGARSGGYPDWRA